MIADEWLPPGSSPLSPHMISTNPGGGHGDLLLGADSQVGMVGSSVSVILVGWALAQPAGRDPLEWVWTLKLQFT